HIDDADAPEIFIRLRRPGPRPAEIAEQQRHDHGTSKGKCLQRTPERLAHIPGNRARLRHARVPACWRRCSSQQKAASAASRTASEEGKCTPQWVQAIMTSASGKAGCEDGGGGEAAS